MTRTRALIILIGTTMLLVFSSVLAQESLQTAQNTPLALTLPVPDGSTPPYQFTIERPPQNGSLSGDAPDLTYSPSIGFIGQDSIAYTVVDSTGAFSTNTIVISVIENTTQTDQPQQSDSSPVLPTRSDLPRIGNDIRTTTNQAVTLEFYGGTSYAIIQAPKHGTLSGQVPQVRYTPDRGFAGVDVFTYSVTDATGTQRVIPMAVYVEMGDEPLGMAGDYSVQVRPEIILDEGQSDIRVGDQFTIALRFTDDRVSPSQAVFSGYVDVTYNNTAIRVDSINYNDTSYPYLQLGTIDNVLGIVDEVGATTTVTNPAPNPDTDVVFLRATALNAGTTDILVERPEEALSETTVYGLDTDERDNMLFTSTSVTILRDTVGCSIGVDSVGVYRTSDRQWYPKFDNTPGVADLTFTYGNNDDLAVIGDWDGDGVDTVGIYRDGIFYLRNSNSGGDADITFGFGAAGDLPVAGDWDGDCIDEVGLYRPEQGYWFLLFDNVAKAPDLFFQYGIPFETPVAGDWNGDGYDTVGIFRDDDRTWHLRNSNSAGQAEIFIQYGDPARDIPIPGDWDGNGSDTVGVYRTDTGVWFLKNSIEPGFADFSFGYGLVNETPVVGDWDGQ